MTYQTLESTIGNTPLVRLQRLPGDTGNTLLVKLEGNNPAGSVKDRPALSMIKHAEVRGDIKPGDTLIEATSGNTGIALAMAAAMQTRAGGYEAKHNTQRMGQYAVLHQGGKHPLSSQALRLDHDQRHNRECRPDDSEDRLPPE